jgi:hypothetical protein
MLDPAFPLWIGGGRAAWVKVSYWAAAEKFFLRAKFLTK